MEIADRDRIERQLTARLAAILDEWRRKLRPAETGQPPAEEEERELSLLLLLLLLPIWENAAEQLLEAGGLQPGRRVVGQPSDQPRTIFAPSEREIRVNSLLGAGAQARTAAQRIVSSTRNRLNEAFGAVLSNDMSAADFEALLDQLFGEGRAETIAITETTGARTGGFENGRRFFAERGLPLLAVWISERDAKVCKICKPLDGQGERIWRQTQPNGPPAHVSCRCQLGYVAADGTELN